LRRALAGSQSLAGGLSEGSRVGRLARQRDRAYLGRAGHRASVARRARTFAVVSADNQAFLSHGSSRSLRDGGVRCRGAPLTNRHQDLDQTAGRPGLQQPDPHHRPGRKGRRRTCSPGQAKEPRPRPMRPGDLLGDRRQRAIVLALIFEPVFANDYGVGASAPLTHQRGAGLQHDPGIRASERFRRWLGSGLRGSTYCCGPRTSQSQSLS